MLITATSDIKKNMVVTTPAAGSLAPGAAELVLWFGGDAGPDVVARNGVQRCLEGLREADTPGAAYGAKVDTGALGGPKPQVVVAAGAPTVSDKEVGIAYGASFHAEGKSITAVVNRAMERFLEEQKSV